ncbi:MULTISPECIES: D-2-hydroxyacid dehydrogenase [unclassified Bradyrhizobium]|uniref:D-2-hydroxyacid dehydrogenase n=1 Tax=unclassified Bradyrhizobium TaxID=2631580 RepID=UPI001CD48EF8|nr:MULTISPECIES: D-2-hydroxyacid dehydrogenase [unclassified Bradyrhizobium]MCA1386360.1 D-2-hydroxyacid dehydrogenase [Bradyrhizobium sp. BRP05]MCA1394463.1 D-2-hydroxyacid dehydrogenase [Bradyrhizobium sp. IC3123]MCA1423956.1 D-2-hydroxyacid dehydrogenase [Bradyrhizobium sp. BRP23]MCA1431152.1 D-2-hydroxyacid dehydrogenase [Bradyrhizobium sp. NBAIM16]MCA1480534.1 D-2-hydroxyacid dehydrogenase [Bradyrhizobium sp. NBAIM08]
MSSTSAAENVVTVLLYAFAGDDYAASIHKRFSHVRVLIAKDQASLDQHVAEADVLLAHSFPAEIFDKARRLRWFQCASAGVDSVLSIRDRVGDLVVTNVRGMHGEVIADFVMAGMTMMHWDFPRFMREQSRKEWRPRSIAPLAERTLGVVGLGSIGTAIARRAKSAGMTVIGSKRDVTQPVSGIDTLFPPEGLAEVLGLSDFVVLAVPHVSETTRLIGRKELQLMRRTAFLINIARGSVIAENELVEALQGGTIAGALLDVFEREPLPVDSPLWTMPNVIVTPHVAGWLSDYNARALEIFNDNLQRFLDRKPLRNVVDLKRGY